jgi:hypothetical protein
MNHLVQSIAVAVVLIGAVFWLAFKLFAIAEGPFKYDERNPYRRWCLHCHQQQNMYCRAGFWRDGWWEDVGTVHDEQCVCHRYQEYRR